MFNHRECLNEISQALQPVVEKYRVLMDYDTQDQLAEGTITEYEALCRLIDPAIEAAHEQARMQSLRRHPIA